MSRFSPRQGPAATPSTARPTLEEIVRDHLPLLTACVTRTLGGKYVAADVEDVVADSLLEIHRALPKYDPRRRIQAWIYRIAQLIALDRRRYDGRARRAGSLVASELESIADEAPNPEDLMARHELRRLLDGFIGTLPEGDREILNMRLSGLSVSDMAEALDQPEGTVSSRVRRAEAALDEAAKRHQAAQRQVRGVAVLPLVMADVMERVGADAQDVPEGMRERVTELLRARLVGGARAPSTPRLPALPARLGSGVTGIGGGLVALAGLVILLLTLRGPSPSPSATAGPLASAPVSTPALALGAVPAATPAQSASAAASDATEGAAPHATAVPSAPVTPSPHAQRLALVRAFSRALQDGKRDEACAKLRDYDAHHFTDLGADTDRVRMAHACDQAKP